MHGRQPGIQRKLDMHGDVVKSGDEFDSGDSYEQRIAGIDYAGLGDGRGERDYGDIQYFNREPYGQSDGHPHGVAEREHGVSNGIAAGPGYRNGTRMYSEHAGVKREHDLYGGAVHGAGGRDGSDSD